MTTIKNREELLNDPSVLQQIQERAYFISESNGFAPELDAQNWLNAETEVLSTFLSNGTNGSANGATNGISNGIAAEKLDGAANGAVKAPKAPRKTVSKKVAAIVEASESPAPVEVPPVATPKKRAPKKSA